MYQALYRKYRPQTFDDVIGQNHITESLKNQIVNDRLSHAYIFIGTRGTGKTTCARILAKAVNCEHPINGNPCCQCDSCRGIADGSIMDIVELDAASNNGIDNVRALRDEAIFSPSSVKKRVYIIDEVHMLSTQAFNALLKILEEPPKHLLFVLATTELQKVPATILSRCQRHAFRRVELNELSNYLLDIAQKEKLNLSHEAANLIASLGEGSVRDSMSMLDQCSSYENIDINEVYSAVGLAGNSKIISLFDKLANKETDLLLSEFNDLWKNGKDAANIIKELSSFARDTLILKVAPNGANSIIYGGYDREALNKYANTLSVAELTNYVEILQDTLVKMKDRVNPKMSAEIALIKLSSGNEQIFEVPKVKNSSLHEKDSINNISNYIPQIPIKTASEEIKDVPIVNNKQEIKAENNITKVISDELQEFWPVLCKLLKTDLRFIDDEKNVQPNLENNILTLYVTDGFYFTRFNKPETSELVEQKLKEITNKEFKVKICKLNQTESKAKDLKELGVFPEVKYI